MRPTIEAAVRRALLWDPDGRGAVWLAIRALTMLVLVVAVGRALGWGAVQLAFVAAMAMITLWATRSIVGVITSAFAAIGVIGAIIAWILAVDATLGASLHLTWPVIGVVWSLVTVGLGLAARRAQWPIYDGVLDLPAAWLATLIAAAIGLRLDFASSMLQYLVHVEDNEAWVSMTTQIHASPTIGPGFTGTGLGTVTPLLLGLLGEAQNAGIPYYNAAFSAYALIIVLTPIAVAGLFLGGGSQRVLVTLAFLGAAIGWALQVPFHLFAGFGHLSAILVFFFILLAVGVIASPPGGLAKALWLTAMLFAIGMIWFPLIPLALAGIVITVNIVVRGSGRWPVAAALALLVVFAGSLAHQGASFLGLWSGGGLGGARSAVDAMYASQGGTATLDAVLQVIIVLGVVGAAFVKGGDVYQRIWRCACAGIGYVLLVFAGSYVAKQPIAYGPTKLWFIFGFAVAVLLIALLARVSLTGRATVTVLIALYFGSLLFGGTGALLSRSWPGGGSQPTWLPAVTAVVNQGADRPIACLSNDKYAAYFCTRWAGGLSTAGSGTFLDYRIQIMNELDPTAEVDAIVARGDLAEAAVIMLDQPDAANSWARTLIDGAGSVYGADGVPVNPR